MEFYSLGLLDVFGFMKMFEQVNDHRSYIRNLGSCEN